MTFGERRHRRRVRIAHAHDIAAAAGYFGDRRQISRGVGVANGLHAAIETFPGDVAHVQRHEPGPVRNAGSLQQREAARCDVRRQLQQRAAAFLLPTLVGAARQLPEKHRAAVRLPGKLIVVVQRPDGGRVERQINRTFDQTKVRRQLSQQKAVANPASGRRIEYRLLGRATFQETLFDHVVERRGVADMARPDFVKHAIGTLGDAKSLRFLKVEVVGAFEQRRRLAKPTETLVKANRS